MSLETILSVRDGVRGGQASARDTVSEALRQLESVDEALGASSQIFRDDALAAADALDERIRRGEDPGPLAGVPFTVKDNIATRRGRTTAASRILESYRSPYDATVVERLVAAGGICVGKSNLDEFGMGSSTENSAFGTTRNPWRTSHVPGGSSGGAAALAAATSGMLHLGSDTGGSIRQPASYCGVTGLKPSYGRVSRYGLLAFGSSLDQIGPIQHTALECALALEVIAGLDAMDTTSRDVAVKSYVEECGKDVSGLRVGVAEEFLFESTDPEVRARIEEGVDTLRSLGVEVVPVSLPHSKYANPTYVLVSGAEASSNLSRYDGVHYGHRSEAAADLADLYRKSRGEGFGPEVKRRILIGTFVLSSGYYDAYYLKALKVRSLIRRDFERAFEKVDAIVGPTSPVTAFPIGERIDDPLLLYAVDTLTVAANLASVPGISFPCGLTSGGLPVGLQLHGRPMEDDVVLRIAHAYQSVTQHHAARPAEVCAWTTDGETGRS